jgi:hypothetical protein
LDTKIKSSELDQINEILDQLIDEAESAQ